MSIEQNDKYLEDSFFCLQVNYSSDIIFVDDSNYSPIYGYIELSNCYIMSELNDGEGIINKYLVDLKWY